MRILFVAAEAAPIAKAGGMGDVVGSLPKVLRQLGHDVRIFLPYYGFLPEKLNIPEQPVWRGSAMSQGFAVHETTLPDTDVPLYLLAHHSFNPRYIYGGNDEDWRFTFFANCAAEFAWNYWKPDIIHCHDWHTGMIPVWMHETADIKTIFTIHNLAYQGPWRWYLEKITWCPWYMKGDNAMAAALMFADRVNTVSPTYAKQIQTSAYGEKLEGLLSFISGKMYGIVNGIDTQSYNPTTDTCIANNFDSKNTEIRVLNKITLQEEVGLTIDENVFLVGIVSRFVAQKGLDLLLHNIDNFMRRTNFQLIILGTGDRYYETQFWQAANNHRGRISVQILHNDALSRRIYSSCDAFFMPSRFEPCGISQMLAMRYGCVPIVRRTGGLVDTVTFHDPELEEGTGFCFDNFDPLDFYTCSIRAWEAFRYKEQWQKLQQRGMETDFSWYKSAVEYIKMYKETIGLPAELNGDELSKLNLLTNKGVDLSLKSENKLTETPKVAAKLESNLTENDMSIEVSEDRNLESALEEDGDKLVETEKKLEGKPEENDNELVTTEKKLEAEVKDEIGNSIAIETEIEEVEGDSDNSPAIAVSEELENENIADLEEESDIDNSPAIDVTEELESEEVAADSEVNLVVEIDNESLEEENETVEISISPTIADDRLQDSEEIVEAKSNSEEKIQKIQGDSAESWEYDPRLGQYIWIEKKK